MHFAVSTNYADTPSEAGWTATVLCILQEPVQALRAEYKHIINRLPEVLSTEQTEQVHLCNLSKLCLVYARTKSDFSRCYQREYSYKQKSRAGLACTTLSKYLR